MNVTDNMQKRGRPTAGDSLSALRGVAPGANLPGARAARKFELSAAEIERFLHVVSRASGVRSHYELFQLLQGDVQFFIPREVLICACGDFRGPNLMLDVVSALRGVRTSLVEACPIGEALGKLRSD